MPGGKTSETHCIQYELEIEINAPCDQVWKAIMDETNFWWLPDFHMVAPDSTVTFDTAPGGRGLVETCENGEGLLWYSVHYHLPQHFTIYLVGQLAPDWGGPSTSHLKLALEVNQGGCVLKVSDAHFGRISQESIDSLSSGWTRLFTDGLKAYVEQGLRQDQ